MKLSQIFPSTKTKTTDLKTLPGRALSTGPSETSLLQEEEEEKIKHNIVSIGKYDVIITMNKSFRCFLLFN